MTARPACDFGDFDRDAHGCLPIKALVAVDDSCDVGPDCFSMTTNERTTARKRKDKTVNDTEQIAPLPLVETPLAHANVAEVQPSVDIPDVMALIPKGEPTSGSTVMIAMIAVVGSGAAMKLWQTISKNKHEERMKELDQKSNDHSKCHAERMALESRVNEIAAKLDEATKSKPALPDLPDFDEIEERLSKIEKATAQKKPSSTSTKK